MLLTNPQRRAHEAALAKLELVVVQDMFMNELAREFGHVFLPACSSFEKDGTFMNSERRVQRVRKAVEPRRASRSPTGRSSALVAQAMGKGDRFRLPLRRGDLGGGPRGLEGGRRHHLRRGSNKGGLQWPCPTEDHPGTDHPAHGQFPHGHARAAASASSSRPTRRRQTPEFPFLLTTGRTLYQFNAGTMTMRTPNSVLRPTDLLEISVMTPGVWGSTTALTSASPASTAKRFFQPK